MQHAVKNKVHSDFCSNHFRYRSNLRYRSKWLQVCTHYYLNVRLGRQNIDNRFGNVISFQYLFTE